MATARTPRLDPEERRRQILDATVRVAARDGFPDLTIDAVAREAGITRPVVYDLFGDFGGLVGALVDEGEVRAMAAVEAAMPDLEGNVTPPDELLAQAMRTFLEAVRADADVWQLILLPPQGAPREVRERTDRQRARVVERIAGLLGWWLDQVAPLGDAVDRTVLARSLSAAIEDMARLVLDRPAAYTPERITTFAAQLVRLVPTTTDSAR